MLVFVEFLTLRTWTFAVLPHILRNVFRKRPQACLFIDATPLGRLAARISAFCLPGLSVERLNFRLIDVRDESGLLSRLTIPYFELKGVQDDAALEPEFQEFSMSSGEGRLGSFVFKSLAVASLTDRQSLWRVLFLIRVCAWSKRQQKSDDAVLFLESRVWFSTVRRYAAKHGIAAIPVARSVNWRKLPLQLLSAANIARVQALRDRLLRLKYGRSASAPITASPKLATDYWGYFNLDRPECYSDLFFVQQSEFPGKSVLMTFSLPSDPIDEKRFADLSAQGVRAVALNARSTTTAAVPLFTFWPKFGWTHSGAAIAGRRVERRWLRRQSDEYWMLRDYWTELFRRENVKLFTTWYRFDAAHCAIGDAMRSVGGIMSVYQRAFQPDASPEIAIDTDVAFGYSPFDAQVERRSRSSIRYHVSVGYMGDHRFPLLRESAANLRVKLQSHGARFIIAFFDENSGPDDRWHTGHRFQAENYAFLLEKLLADPSLGLVFKPKVPATLRRRLGPVVTLLEKALATGRCFLYEEGAVQGSHPPSGAAMAADIAIHGHLSAATAGLEAALAGVPTLLLDREGWKVSEMYRLGLGRVVFQSWDSLWQALAERRESGRIQELGDWSSMLDTFDPFRDGRAAERMGTYLLWLFEGLNKGGTRDLVMAEAAERYGRLWGRDKVVQIN